MIPWVLTLICALVAIGLWVYGYRAQRRHEEILNRLAQPRPGGIVLPPSTSYTPFAHSGMTTMSKSLAVGAAPIRAYDAVSRPEGVWAVAGAFSEQPVVVAPSRRAADLLAFWLSCDPVAVDHEVMWLCQGKTNPMLPQLYRRITAMAEEAEEVAKAEAARGPSGIIVLPDES